MVPQRRFQPGLKTIAGARPRARPGAFSRLSRFAKRHQALISAMSAAALAGAVIMNWAMESLPLPGLPGGGVPVASATSDSFRICGTFNRSACVIDGDTIDFRGQRIRMIDYDAPEIGEPKCDSERALGHRAKNRLVEILNSGTVEIRMSGTRDVDRFGRKLRLVTVNGRSVGDTLIAEGLAWPWEGRRHAWCTGP